MRKGTVVSWKWGNGMAHGKVKEVFKEETTRKIKGKEITRKGTPENPALLIEQEDGDEVLKLSSEVEESKGSRE